MSAAIEIPAKCGLREIFWQRGYDHRFWEATRNWLAVIKESGKTIIILLWYFAKTEDLEKLLTSGVVLFVDHPPCTGKIKNRFGSICLLTWRSSWAQHFEDDKGLQNAVTGWLYSLADAEGFTMLVKCDDKWLNLNGDYVEEWRKAVVLKDALFFVSMRFFCK